MTDFTSLGFYLFFKYSLWRFSLETHPVLGHVSPIRCLCCSVCQRAAHCTDPNPCLHPPCTRGVWAPRVAPPTASHPTATASPATPTPSWAPRHPATTWTRLGMGSPHRSVPNKLRRNVVCMHTRRAQVFFALQAPLLHLPLPLFRTCNCIWLKIKIQKQHVQQNNHQCGLLCSPSKALDLF